MLASQEEARRYALLVKKLQFDSDLDKIAANRAQDVDMRNDVIKEINSIETSQKKIAERLKNAPTWLKDKVTSAMQTKPEDAKSALETLIRQHDESEKALESTLALYQEKLNKHHDDHSK